MQPFTSDIAGSVIHMQNLRHPAGRKKRTEDSPVSPMKSNLFRFGKFAAGLRHQKEAHLACLFAQYGL
jgi:hypothetical protein